MRARVRGRVGACVRARQIRNVAPVAFGRFRRTIVNAAVTRIQKCRIRDPIFSRNSSVISFVRCKSAGGKKRAREKGAGTETEQIR